MGGTELIRCHGGSGYHGSYPWLQDGCDDPEQFAPDPAGPHRNVCPVDFLMIASSPEPRLRDIVDAIGYIRLDLENTSLESFAGDRRKRWQVERGPEVISEASRHLLDDLKARHPGIPWRKVAGI